MQPPFSLPSSLENILIDLEKNRILYFMLLYILCWASLLLFFKEDCVMCNVMELI